MGSILIYGVIEGVMIALVAMALAMIYSGLRILDISVGGVYIAASYFMIQFLVLLQGISMVPAAVTFGISFLLAIAASVLMSFVIEKAVYQPFYKKNTGPMTGLIISLALFTAIINVVAMTAGVETRIIGVPESFNTSYDIKNIIITRIQVIQLIVSCLFLAGSLLLLYKTSLGRKIIALADNPAQFQAIGHDVPRTRLDIMLFASVLIATSSVLKSIDIGIDPFSSGFNVVLIAAVAMIFGGVTNFYGIIAGSLILGILMNLTAWFLPGEWKMAMVFIVLILLLVLRKEGFFAQRLRLEQQ